MKLREGLGVPSGNATALKMRGTTRNWICYQTESVINLNEPGREFFPEPPEENTVPLFQRFETQSIDSELNGCSFKPLSLWHLVTWQEKMNTGHWPFNARFKFLQWGWPTTRRSGGPSSLVGTPGIAFATIHLLWLFPLNSNITPSGRPFLNFSQPVDHFLSVVPCSSWKQPHGTSVPLFIYAVLPH